MTSRIDWAPAFAVRVAHPMGGFLFSGAVPTLKGWGT
jgi:hypothetical protein